MGLGIGHYIPLLAYLAFWVMCLLSLTGRPLLGLYYLLPFLPYRTLRDHFESYPLGGNMLTILVLCVLVGAMMKHKKLPPSALYLTWGVFALYLYFSLWIGTAISNAPLPLWLSDPNFVTWKDYMLLPLLLLAASMVVEDRKAVRNIVILTGITLLLIDRSALMSSLSRSWTVFDEDKRDPGPLAFGVNELGAFLAQFAMFFWGFVQFMKRKKVKLACYGLVALTVPAILYTFSRGAYLAVLLSVAVLAVLKDRKLLIALALFLVTWQSLVPSAVTQRVMMTTDSSGRLEASAQERVDLWTQSREMFLSSPVFGRGYATFQFGEHTANLKDTHNWYVKVLVETGIIGGAIAAAILFQMVAAGFRLFRTGRDPLYRSLGLGFLLAVISCLVSNLFGDRWTYLEINGLLWVLCGTVLRAQQLSTTSAWDEDAKTAIPGGISHVPPHLAWTAQ